MLPLLPVTFCFLSLWRNKHGCCLRVTDLIGFVWDNRCSPLPPPDTGNSGVRGSAAFHPPSWGSDPQNRSVCTTAGRTAHISTPSHCSDRGSVLLPRRPAGPPLPSPGFPKTSRCHPNPANEPANGNEVGNGYWISSRECVRGINLGFSR